MKWYILGNFPSLLHSNIQSLIDIELNSQKISLIIRDPTMNIIIPARVEKVSTKNIIAQSNGIPINKDDRDANNRTSLLLLSLICFFKPGLISVIIYPLISFRLVCVWSPPCSFVSYAFKIHCQFFALNLIFFYEKIKLVLNQIKLWYNLNSFMLLY